MDKNSRKKTSGKNSAPVKNKGKSKGKRLARRLQAKNTALARNAKLIEQIRQVIAEAPDIRPEKVGPVQEALEQGTYQINVRKLANILIAKLFLEP
jgi:flagellar biosynthesis anti-sigma factor FlgM